MQQVSWKIVNKLIGTEDYKCVITNLLTCPAMCDKYWQTLWDWFVILLREPVKTFSMLSSITVGIYGFLLALENEVPEVTFPVMLETLDYLWTEASACNLLLLHLIIMLLKKCRMRMEKRNWWQSINCSMKHSTILCMKASGVMWDSTFSPGKKFFHRKQNIQWYFELFNAWMYEY